MKIESRKVCILTLALTFCFCRASAHEKAVHQEIAQHAVDAALSQNQGYSEFLNVVSLEIGSTESGNNIRDGAFHEDDMWEDNGGFRSFNHFYDPISGQGLSNIPIDDKIKPPMCPRVGTNSFSWAAFRNCPGVNFLGIPSLGLGVNVNTYNEYSWQNVRDKEWLGLTALKREDRKDALAKMFLGLGHVLHLLEDDSQPQHVRNEQHLLPFWRSYLETYGGNNRANLIYGSGVLDWRAAGFSKLEDFWNRHHYNGNGSALSDGSTLGLAEFANGNFIGKSHSFPEYSSPGSVAYYPFPSRDHSTTYNQVKSNPQVGVKPLKIGDHLGQGVYLSKNSDGVNIEHLCRVNYLGAKIPGLSGAVYCTIYDDNVLKDYHDIIIPKAVEYSAGLLDYFFRGQLQISVTWDSANYNYNLQVINTSSQALCSGGTIYVYQDDTKFNRTLVTGQLLTSDLRPGDSVTIQIAGPVADTTKCIVFYRGTIGKSGDLASDPVDAGIAIAVKGFTLVPETDPNFPCPDCGGQPCNGCPTMINPNSNSIGIARVESTSRPKNRKDL